MLDGTIDRDTYKRKHVELEEAIRNLDAQAQDVDNKSRIDMDLIEEVLAFTRNIHKTYLEAPMFMKRHYLRFFYEKIVIENKVILKTEPTPIFASLIENHQVIIRNAMLPLVNMFRNREIEFGVSLRNIQTLNESFNLSLFPLI